ncbi:MAG: SIMPL domain-containing protein [Mycobacteriaceae bacterium]
MIRQTICAATAFAAIATLSGCDSAPPVQANARQVTVVGSGEVQGTPDTVTADVGIEVSAPDVTTAMNQAGERQQAVIDALTADGIDAKDISTTAVNLQPQYGDNSVVTGYRAGNNINVKIRVLDNASRALAAIVDTGGNSARINSVSFSIADDSKLVSDARARAFEDAKGRAKQYAELSGMSLGRIISISEAPGSTPPQPFPVPAEARAAGVPLQPGQQTVSFSVNAVWELT